MIWQLNQISTTNSLGECTNIKQTWWITYDPSKRGRERATLSTRENDQEEIRVVGSINLNTRAKVRSNQGLDDITVHLWCGRVYRYIFLTEGDSFRFPKNRKVAPMMELMHVHWDYLHQEWEKEQQERRRRRDDTDEEEMDEMDYNPNLEAPDSTVFQSKKQKVTSCIRNPYFCSVYVQ